MLPFGVSWNNNGLIAATRNLLRGWLVLRVTPLHRQCRLARQVDHLVEVLLQKLARIYSSSLHLVVRKKINKVSFSLKYTYLFLYLSVIQKIILLFSFSFEEIIVKARVIAKVLLLLEKNILSFCDFIILLSIATATKPLYADKVKQNLKMLYADVARKPRKRYE